MAAKPEKPADVDRSEWLSEIAAELKRSLDDIDTPASAKAALSKELRQVMAQLEAKVEPEGVSTIDALAARRAARRSDATDSASTARRGQPRRSNGSHRTGGIARDDAG